MNEDTVPKDYWEKCCREQQEKVERLERELAKYQTDPASYVEAVKCLCGSVDDFIKYHHNPIVKQKNEEILALKAKLSEAEETISETEQDYKDMEAKQECLLSEIAKDKLALTNLVNNLRECDGITVERIKEIIWENRHMIDGIYDGEKLAEAIHAQMTGAK